jgi:DNA (cytosine-5)-methyltransferase 1
MTAFLDLFSGIGGFALGAYWAGLRFDKHYFSEIDDYAVQLYQKRFPEAEPLGDIRYVDYAKLPRGEYLVTGGFPCQPHSAAGLRKGADDQRDLWPECSRMLRELRPAIALFENVRGLFTSPGREHKGEFFNGILSDIFKCGYDAEWQIISAQDAGAPHLRRRVWIVAHPPCLRLEGDRNKQRERRKGVPKAREEWKQFYKTPYRDNKILNWQEIESELCGDDDGLPFDMERYKCIGNAIVPQCAQMIFSLSAFDRWRLAV